MQLTRCKDQKSQTLDEFYAELCEGDEFVGRNCGKAMLGLVERLRELPDDKVVFGLTSHHRLCLLAGDFYQSPRLVVVSALDDRNYFIEYLIPEELAVAQRWQSSKLRDLALQFPSACHRGAGGASFGVRP